MPFCQGFDYDLPEWGPLDVYKRKVEELPLNNGPAVFGLHPNAEIGYYTTASKGLWKNLIELQPRSTTAGEGVSREEHIDRVVKDIQSKIPEPVDLMNLRKKIVADHNGDPPSPTEIVLLQELERWNMLVTRMEASLLDLSRALTGEIGMSDSLEELGDALFNGFLPSMWRALAPDTEKALSSWMKHFSDRLAQYNDWMENGEPKVMWLSGLHIPESYLTALVQMTCRRKNWPLDRSSLYTTVRASLPFLCTHCDDLMINSCSCYQVTKFRTEEEVETRPEDGCYVRGLYLEGASWDLERGCLGKQHPKVLVEQLPIMQVIPVGGALKLNNTFKTPVYVTQARRNAMGVGLVFEADLYSEEHSSHWVLQGVALSLNTDE